MNANNKANQRALRAMTPEQLDNLRIELAASIETTFPAYAGTSMGPTMAATAVEKMMDGMSLEAALAEAQVVFEARLALGDPEAKEIVRAHSVFLLTQIKPVVDRATANGQDPVAALLLHKPDYTREVAVTLVDQVAAFRKNLEGQE